MDTSSPDDDDYELELEAVDPEVLELQKRRGERQFQETEVRSRRLELFDEVEQTDPITLDQLRKFRFTTRHLMIATAVLAIGMALFRRLQGGAVFLVWVALLAGGWWYVLRKERLAQQARLRRHQHTDEELARIQTTDEGERIASRVGQEDRAEGSGDTFPRPSLSFSFSVKQILGAMAVAAVVLTLATLMGPQNAAWILGAIAGLGLAVHFLGFELPGIVVFGWWMLLVLYLVVSLWAMMFGGSPPTP
jgi:hypothetical protein